MFIIGFPLGISIGEGLPLWKSGYIASEPYFDVTLGGEISDTRGPSGGRTISAFFIDSQTRSGMSGSPVFASYTGTWDMRNPYVTPTASDYSERPDEIILSGIAREFIGCYSGRAGTVGHEAALGICWRKDAIEAICSARVRGQNPH